MFYKRDNFCDFLIKFLHTNRLLEKGLLLKEKNYSAGEQCFTFFMQTHCQKIQNECWQGRLPLNCIKSP